MREDSICMLEYQLKLDARVRIFYQRVNCPFPSGSRHSLPRSSNTGEGISSILQDSRSASFAPLASPSHRGAEDICQPPRVCFSCRVAQSTPARHHLETWARDLLRKPFFLAFSRAIFPAIAVGVTKRTAGAPAAAAAVAAAPSGFSSSSRSSARSRAVVCRKSIQLAGFHGAKPGAIVPRIGIFTTPPPPPPPTRWRATSYYYRNQRIRHFSTVPRFYPFPPPAASTLFFPRDFVYTPTTTSRTLPPSRCTMQNSPFARGLFSFFLRATRSISTDDNDEN